MKTTHLSNNHAGSANPKIKKLIYVLFALLLVSVLTFTSGCSDTKQKFVGEWKGTNFSGEPIMLKIKKQDNKFVVFGGDNQLPVEFNESENAFIGKEENHTLEIKYQKSNDKLIFSFDGKIVECDRIK